MGRLGRIAADASKPECSTFGFDPISEDLEDFPAEWSRGSASV